MKKKVKNKDNFIIKHKDKLIGLIVGLVLGIVVMLILWPKRVPKLASGEEVLASVKGNDFTANDLYEKLKKSNGNDALIELIDNYILHQKYDLKEEAEKWAKEQSETIYETYETYYGYNKEDFLGLNGFEDEDAFLKYLNDEYYFQEYYKDYVGNTIKESEVKDYYEKQVFGNKEVYLFSSADKSNDLESIRKMLKKGKTYDEITKKYPNVTAANLESVSYQDVSSYSETVINKIAKTKKGKYSEVFEDDAYGYVVVYVVKEEEKKTYAEMKDEVLDFMISQKQASDETLYNKAFIELRKEYDIKFYDTEIEKKYKETIKEYEK